MSETNGIDPVTAVSESAATGRTAEIFADIRDVMEIPLITSIWRILDGIEGGLESAWNATRPLYQSGRPQAVLEELKASVSIPGPAELSAAELDRMGVTGGDRPAVDAIFRAYNRSNGLNLIALNGLIATAETESVAAEQCTADAASPTWPTLRPLLEQADIEPTTWALLEEIRFLGSSEQDPSIATLWRHLSQWPGLLEQIVQSYSPLQQDGTLHAAAREAGDFALTKGASLAPHRGDISEIPPEALELIAGYVGNPSAVSRMVVLGNSVERWLAGA